MRRVIVASLNPVKAKAALEGFRLMFPGEAFEVSGVAVESGVSRQPMSDEEALQGARNRAESARAAVPDADFWVGMEGGVEERSEGLASFAWIVVLSGDREGRGRTGVFFLPDRVASLVREGAELGAANDFVFGRTNSKHDSGAVGLLTGGAIDRAELYAHAVVLALIPFRNPELFG